MNKTDKTTGNISTSDKDVKRFRLGLSIFFTGLVFLYITNEVLEDSLSQEIFSLFFIVIISVGFILAIISETRFVLTRIVTFFKSK